jgi:hypothetical protein
MFNTLLILENFELTFALKNHVALFPQWVKRRNESSVEGCQIYSKPET